MINVIPKIDIAFKISNELGVSLEVLLSDANVDGFIKNNVECDRTQYNKAGNKDNRKIRIVPLPLKLILLL